MPKKIVKGFTLIELLVVVAIIGIISTIGVVGYNGYTKAAYATVVKKIHYEVIDYAKSELTKCFTEIENSNGEIQIFNFIDWPTAPYWNGQGRYNCHQRGAGSVNAAIVGHFQEISLRGGYLNPYQPDFTKKRKDKVSKATRDYDKLDMCHYSGSGNTGNGDCVVRNSRFEPKLLPWRGNWTDADVGYVNVRTVNDGGSNSTFQGSISVQTCIRTPCTGKNIIASEFKIF